LDLGVGFSLDFVIFEFGVLKKIKTQQKNGAEGDEKKDDWGEFALLSYGVSENIP